MLSRWGQRSGQVKAPCTHDPSHPSLRPAPSLSSGWAARGSRSLPLFLLWPHSAQALMADPRSSGSR